MDLYTEEKLLLERHRRLIEEAERRARLDPMPSVTLRTWMAARLRLLADRLEGAPLAQRQRPTA
ncbi:MAG TPA: hypothetical protein VLK30_14875 [Candidatus Limnocylindrales bacterium]|nr:hypothetical protein [Candidatus Limnocylindrales bacterium]